MAHLHNVRGIHPKTAMARLVRDITAAQQRVLDDLKLQVTAQQFAVVSLVGLAGPRTMSDIGGVLGVDQSVATRLVDRLEAGGNVVRSPSSEDGRAVVVALTPSGERIFAEGSEAINGLKDQIMAGVSADDVDVFWNVVIRMQDNAARELDGGGSGAGR